MAEWAKYYATYGMFKNFEKIPFNYSASGTSVSVYNTGIYREIGTQTSGKLSDTAFRASGVSVEKVRSLTLADLNRATNAANGNSDRAETSTSSGFKDITGTDNIAVGLFDMRKLTGYGETNAFEYTLATPYSIDLPVIISVTDRSAGVTTSNSGTYGLRPVIVLSSDISIVESETPGVYKIKDK